MGTLKFGSKSALAQAMGINSTRLSRLARHTDQHSLGTANCLRLAKHTDHPASDVLRAAGKADVADLIESLYGEDRTHERSAHGRLGTLLTDLRAEMREIASATLLLQVELSTHLQQFNALYVKVEAITDIIREYVPDEHDTDDDGDHQSADPVSPDARRTPERSPRRAPTDVRRQAPRTGTD